jgi:hypothetical protein
LELVVFVSAQTVWLELRLGEAVLLLLLLLKIDRLADFGMDEGEQEDEGEFSDVGDAGNVNMGGLAAG